MREIKFRGKRTDTGEWVYGSLMQWPEIEIAPTLILVADPIYGHIVTRFYVRPDTVGQYTGLKDRNGTEVWEGDLLRTPEGDIMVAEWRDAQIITICVRPYNPLYKNSLTFAYPVSVVIGNIHDNPELLEGEK